MLANPSTEACLCGNMGGKDSKLGPKFRPAIWKGHYFITTSRDK